MLTEYKRRFSAALGRWLTFFHWPPSATLPVATGLLIAFKFWLVRGEDIIGSATQYDGLWYVRSAVEWYWGSAYGWTAFIRPCAYPLWLALVHLLHLPLRVAIELLQLGGALVLLGAFRGLGVNRWTSYLSFACIALHPAGFQLNNYTASDTFYAGVLWYVVGGLLWTYATRKTGPSIATGLAVGILWNTREEAFLIVVLLAVWLALLFLGEKGNRPVAGVAAMNTVRPFAVVCAVAALVVFSAYTANYFVFKSFTRSEMTARSFQSLFHSLLRIRPSEPKPFAPITMDTLHRAFSVSPTFATLSQHLDGPLGEAWRIETYRQTGVPGEIGVGWIVWATREAASKNGVFETPEKAQRFFKQAAREIDAACDDGRLPARFVLGGFLDPLGQSEGWSKLPQSALRVGGRIFARWSLEPVPDDEILTTAEASLYDEMTRRRSAPARENKGSAVALQNFIGRYHFVLVIVLHLGAFGAILLLRRPGLLSPGYTGALLLLGCAVFSRLLLFAWLDATAFDSTQDRFLFPVLPLWMAFLVVTIGAIMQARLSGKPDLGTVGSALR